MKPIRPPLDFTLLNDGALTIYEATKIPPDVCARLNLGYRDPATINVEDYKDREHEGILFVPKAGETLFKLKNPPDWASDKG